MRSPAFRSSAVTAPGGAGDLVGIGLPHGEARAVVIDNPSGSWLTVFPLHDLVPPYTLQWSRDFPYTVANVTIRYTTGPAGQASSIEGTPFTAWLDSDPVGASNGVATPGEAFRPLTTPTIDTLALETSLGLPITMVPANVGRVMRLYSFRIITVNDDIISTMDMGYDWRIQYDPLPFGVSPFAFGNVTRERALDEVDFTTNPRDIAMTFNISVLVQPMWLVVPAPDSVPPVTFRYHLRWSLV